VRARNAGYALALRAAEAITLRAHVTERLDDHGQQRAPIVMGDLTDEPLAATTQMLLGPPGSEIGTPALTAPIKVTGSGYGTLPRGSQPSGA
jgi:hypothetical protein